MDFILSESAFKKAKEHLVGGVNSPVRAFNSVGGNPLFIKSGKGQYIFDIDGNQYIDYVASYGPMVLGHVYPEVLEAVHKACEKGFSFGATTETEVELSILIKKAFPSVDMVRFVNSGTEATMSAIRLARACTKRNKVIKFAGCYHGHEDGLLVAAGSGVVTNGLPGSEGVPEEVVKDTLVAIYNDLESVELLLKRFEGQVATIIIEPVAGNMGVVLPQHNFLKKLETLAHEHNVLLIIDEVMTGFRSKFGGAQDFYDVKGDIVCLGKVIGGGFPVGAYAARKEIMGMISPLGPVYQAGTLSGNPIAMAAGLKTLQLLKELNPYPNFEMLTKQIKASMLSIAESKGVPLYINQFGSMFNPFFTDTVVKDFVTAQKTDVKKFKQFFWNMIKAGVYIPPSNFESWFLGVMHSDSDINKTLEAFEQSI